MSETNSLHILAFNISYPANYGVIDVFHKILALKKAGVRFTYIALNMDGNTLTFWRC